MVACLPGRLPLVAVFAFIQQTKFGRPARDRRVERVTIAVKRENWRTAGGRTTRSTVPE
jgi:hypothetical protein